MCRCPVLLLVPRKAQSIVALLLVLITVGAVIACQIHTTAIDHQHAMPARSHHSSSTHALFDFSCIGMAAVLPMVVLFTSLFFHVLYATLLVLKHAGLIVSPFVPPRSIAH